ncbi:MAG: NADP-dependent oxidoreductase [Gemmatimonadales bacterium]
MPERRRRPTSPLTFPEVMQAAAIDKFGPPSALSIHQLPVPRPSPREVLIALEWAGVGVWDASIRDGSWSEGKPKFPLVPGVDGAGIVVAAGARVRRVRVGDRVYAYEFGNPKGGFYAQFAVARADHVDRVPAALATREAAAVVTTGLTAMQGLSLLRLRRGSTVLIFGASGAVGTIAVQIAKRNGATVIATASGRPASRVVRRLGAELVVDARNDSGVDRVRRAAPKGLDAVFALAGGEELERCLDLLRRGGRIAYPNGIEPEPEARPGVTARSFDAVADPQQFRRLRKYLGDRRMQAPLAGVYPLSQAARAHRRLEQGHIVGRIVLRVPRAGIVNH